MITPNVAHVALAGCDTFEVTLLAGGEAEMQEMEGPGACSAAPVLREAKKGGSMSDYLPSP